MSSKPSPGKKRTKSVTVKAAWIAGGCAVAGAMITAVLPLIHGNGNGSNASEAPSIPAVPAVSSSVAGGPFVAVRREAGVSGGCGTWIVPKAPQDVSPLPTDGNWEVWAAENHAIDATNSHLSPSEGNPAQNVAVTDLDVTIQGRSSAQIVLTGIQFVIVHRGSTPIHGGVVARACGGPIAARYMVVDLDNSPANIVASARDSFPAPSDEPWQGTPVTFPYYVTDTNGEVFKIIAYTHSDVTWYAELFWSVDGKNGQSIISDDGKSFETAVWGRAAAVYGYKGNNWYVCSSSVSATTVAQCMTS
jgi:hypothetical protein